MRSITQTIVLDRLQQALATRGIDLKRHTVLEVAAETFGFHDGNAFVAAMKEGRFDPPAAEPIGVAWHEGTKLTVLRDPLSTFVYAVEFDALPLSGRDINFGLSPYGNLLRVPDMDNDGIPVPQPVARQALAGDDEQGVFYIARVTDDAGTQTHARVAPYSHLLMPGADIQVNCGPIRSVSADRLALMDGRLHFVIMAQQQCRDAEQADHMLQSFQTYMDERREGVRRLGGTMRCIEESDSTNIRMEVLLPVEATRDVDNIDDWHEAIAILLGADRDGVTATFGPQVWVKDNALDTNPEGPVDFDVTIEVLLMGSVAARETEDCRDSSDDLQKAALAPDWIRDWKGPFHVKVEDEIARYLDQRENDHGGIDEGFLRTVMPLDADDLKRRSDIGDPV